MKFLYRLPLLQSLKHYTHDDLISDLLAAVIVTIMLIPQSLAYALLVGVPPEVGLYASIFPLIIYAVFGTSRTISVGPAALTSLMTASALAAVAQQGTGDYLSAAIVLSLLSGLFLLLLGFMRLGFLANFISHPVISGFITASAIIIAFGQLRHIFGIESNGTTMIEIGSALYSHRQNINDDTLLMGISVIVFLLLARRGAAHVLIYFRLSKKAAQLSAKAAPAVGVIMTILAVQFLNLDAKGIALVGEIPSKLSALHFPVVTMDMVRVLWLPAILISIIGYIESISMGKMLAARQRQKVDVNQELVGLGAANIASALSGAFPVTGSISRSSVNFDAGAVTQMASVFTAIGIALVSLFLTPALYYLPNATLAAIIIVAVLSLVDFSIFKKAWQYAKSDFSAVFITVLITLLLGVEAGVSCGVVTSLVLHLYRTSRPHIAEVGLIEGTEHFRNIRRHKALTVPEILSLRVDESLFFANASFLQDEIYNAISQRIKLAHVILICSAVNEIDLSALEVLEAVNARLQEQGIKLHLSEVKGPVMDALKRGHFLQQLSGQVFFTQFEAFKTLKITT